MANNYKFSRALLSLCFPILFGCIPNESYKLPEDWKYISIWNISDKKSYNYPLLELPVAPGSDIGPDRKGAMITSAFGEKNVRKRADFFVIILARWDYYHSEFPCSYRELSTKKKRHNYC